MPTTVLLDSRTSNSILTSKLMCPQSASLKGHKANQPAWQAINYLKQEYGQIKPDDFRLLGKLGSGDVGDVFLCEIKDLTMQFPRCLYAMKVVDKEALEMKNKLHRANTEKNILKLLDHPFLPTLYAEFSNSCYSCLVMNYCPGGDLFSLLGGQPSYRFAISSAKFYAAEVLLGLEYLHMMGIIYRDLKPENVLLQADGHIKLSDFDLSLRITDVSLKLVQRELVDDAIDKNLKCLSWLPDLNNHKERSKSMRKEAGLMINMQEFDYSKSFVGTHEYLAPEIILGLGHGTAVDWWAFGIFLYELIFGKTPFKGENNDKTLRNILRKSLSFPKIHQEDCEEMEQAQDLITKLLARNPKKRLGSSRGSSEIKEYKFFKGMKWALIRSMTPPEKSWDMHGNIDENLVPNLEGSYKPSSHSVSDDFECY